MASTRTIGSGEEIFLFTDIVNDLLSNQTEHLTTIYVLGAAADTCAERMHEPAQVALAANRDLAL